MGGDYGYMEDLSKADMVFNAMNKIAEEKKDPRDNIDFFLTMGDNIYA